MIEERRTCDGSSSVRIREVERIKEHELSVSFSERSGLAAATVVFIFRSPVH